MSLSMFRRLCGRSNSSLMGDLIFVSMENWDEIWRRNQFVISELARRHPQSKILFVGLPRNVSNDLRHGRLKTLRDRATYKVQGVTVTRPIKLLPDSLATGRAINEAMFRRHVRGIAAGLGMHRPVLWLNPHSAVHMVGSMAERMVIYDITDDWTSLTQSPRMAKLVARQDAELCRRADAVIVCSQRLLELKQHMARHVHLIPNGVDAEHYRTVLDGCGDFPPIARGWARPVLGYTGTVHPDRIDASLVESVAQMMPDASIVLIGPNYLSDPDSERLRSRGNVHLTGPVPYGQIPDYMRAFDVCITPHRMTAFTESLNPIKLWEYLAAGKPIVSTDVAGFRDYPQFVRIARDAQGFVAAVRAALAEGVALAEARRQEARRHSWQARVDQIEGVIATCLASGETSAA